MSATTADCEAGRLTIDILPDDVLLLIFQFDRATYPHHEDVHRRWEFLRWHQLVHVCRRWRSVVFASPNFLNLRLVCGPWTPPAELAGIWPPLPIIITNRHVWTMSEYCDFDLAIVHHTRVCEINFANLSRSQLHRLASAMRRQFPALIHLRLGFFNHFRGPFPVLPDEFLGGSASRLQSLELNHIAFPALPNLLLSATNLVRLTLLGIPYFEFVSPEALVTSLAVLANLKFLTFQYEPPVFPRFRESLRLPPPTRTVVPALTRFEFQGVGEYLDDLVARIDTPLLDSMQIKLFQQPIFDFSQLVQFMIRTTRFGALNEAHVNFEHSGVQVGYLPPPWIFGGDFWLKFLKLSSLELDWQFSSLTQVVTSFSHSTYMVEYLYVYGLSSQWHDDNENMQWLEIFHSFTSVKNLYVSWNFSHCIALVLQDLVGESASEVLPALESLYLEDLQPSGPVEEAIGPFVAARQLLGHPVAVSHWKREAD